MRWIAPIALGGLAAVAACPAAKTVDCGGWVCREGNVCAQAPTYCAPPSAVEACLGQGLADLQACTLGGSAGGDPGACVGGACFSCAAAPDTAGCTYPGWVPMTSGTTSDLAAVYAAAPADVYAVGADGSLLHYDGHAWAPLADAGLGLARTVGGNGPGDVYVANTAEHVFRFDGAAWSEVAGSPQGVKQLWGLGAGKLVAATTSGVFELDGGSWSPAIYAGRIDRVSGSGPSDVIAIRTATSVAGSTEQRKSTLQHYDGAGWTDVYALELDGTTTAPPGTPLTWVWSGAATAGFAVGDGDGMTATLAHLEGSWSPDAIDTATVPPVPLASVWAADPAHAFAVGDRATVVGREAGTWEAMCVASSLRPDLAAVSGTGPDDVFAVGSAGTILHYTGVAGTPVTGTCR